MRSTFLALSFVSALGGCAYLSEREAAHTAAEARSDHGVCVARELTFPSAAYTDCRRKLAEERQKHEWMELSLAQQQTRATEPSFVPQQETGVYREIDPARFSCEPHGASPEQVILCRER